MSSLRRTHISSALVPMPSAGLVFGNTVRIPLLDFLCVFMFLLSPLGSCGCDCSPFSAFFFRPIYFLLNLVAYPLSTTPPPPLRFIPP